MSVHVAKNTVIYMFLSFGMISREFQEVLLEQNIVTSFKSLFPCLPPVHIYAMKVQNTEQYTCIARNYHRTAYVRANSQDNIDKPFIS